ncbi:redoxin domain-containing protein [Candidatus Carsonella ruddii]|uniref:Alkyl hydroperoxide reductase C n=1 Tax=Carsonella ruddii TaxID=114186 RepID=A0AAJ6FD14_CARRU|nr:redoxin domain-containing protein [Candidatus Carsonella ruddii]WGS66603.1 redoxin domain-containing protein [Candidatus Carsonella ruddii]WGS66801.1 redoxin domain-containing protein [Candidatus Carsonella ruddii]WGS66992.1 redoxin domain-containing protein [Candidatus Carsonella ruddii]WGS67184.1 redoxin domain-containing protein [Candidatus Carsonella ruddii]WMC18200.1 MAG: redoxin domain-containing protein [Candidatus Carsonella ruddii]
MLNTRIKPFKTISYYKKKFYEIKEKNFLNKWNVLFFFPFSFSFICPTELKEISSYINNFKKINAEIFAISTDSHYTHKKWIENEINFVNFPFISDFNHNLSKNFNVLNKKDGNSYRATIIIDPNLIIKCIELVDINIGRSIIEIEKKIKMLNFVNLNENKVCPYTWNFDSKSINVNV